MAGDNTRIRDAVLAAGAVEPISNILLQVQDKGQSTAFIRNASWTLANLCRGKPNPNFELIKGALPALGKILMSFD